MKYKALLFDWDGCLAQTLGLVVRAYQETFKEYETFPTAPEIVAHLGNWRAAAAFGVTDVERFNDKLVKRINAGYPEIQLYPNVVEVLEGLKNEGAKIALVSTSRKVTIQPAFDRFNLNELFDAFLGAEDVKKYKPDPEMIELALQKVGGKKEEAVIIGDSKSDLGAAQNSGIDSILFYPTENEIFYDINALQKYNPTFVAKSFKEIFDIITKF